MLKVPFTRTVVCLVWLLAVGGGFAVIYGYQNTDGQAGQTPEHWPSASRIALDHNRDTLIMFAHPRCPCTRASIEELNRLLAKSPQKPATQVWFLKPRDLAAEWTRTGLWRDAEAIPGVTAHEDIDGREAALFGAETSGYVLLYDTRGQLLFRGGITASRGHAGESAGENAIVLILGAKAPSLKQTPVYGCSLLGKCEVSSDKAAK